MLALLPFIAAMVTGAFFILAKRAAIKELTEASSREMDAPVYPSPLRPPWDGSLSRAGETDAGDRSLSSAKH